MSVNFILKKIEFFFKVPNFLGEGGVCPKKNIPNKNIPNKGRGGGGDQARLENFPK